VDESPRVRRVRSGVPALPPRPATDGTRGRILLAGLGLFAASWYAAPEAGLNPSQLADVYASLALRIAGARQERPTWPG
jgi:hypothetical protein